RAERGGGAAPHAFDFGRYRQVLASSHVWLLAPTWIAINAALGLWTTQSIFQLVRERDPRFHDQLLMGGFDPALVSAGLAAGLIGGQVARIRGIDAILILTLVLLAIALIPLWRLRAFEHELSPSPDVPPAELEIA